MKVQDYFFGKVEINGKTYTNDLKIFPDKIKSNWWRERGHLLQVKDVEDVFEFEPDLLVIGKGAYGDMKISQKLREKLESSPFEYIAKKTSDAINDFNKSKNQKIVGVFHLTC